MALVIPFGGNAPILGERVWLAPNATVIGNATLGDDVSIWFNAVVRADTLAIVIGARTNVQDNAVLHITSKKPVGPPDARGVSVGLRLGNDVTIGHSAVVHGCTLMDGCLVGIGAIVLDGAVVEPGALVAAGSLVTPGTVIPEKSLAMGRPAKVVRKLSGADNFWSEAAEMYVGYARQFADEENQRNK